MRDARAARPVTDAGREMSLDAASAQLGEMLRRCDQLAAEWAQFGDEVRARVAGEVQAIAQTVDAAISRAAIGATATAVDRAFAADLGARMTGLAAELARLEGRARAAARTIAQDRRTDRTLWYAALAGIASANVLLVCVLLRGPSAPSSIAPAAPPLPVAVDPLESTTSSIATPSLPAPTPEPVGSSAAGSGSGSSTSATAGSNAPTPKKPGAKK